MEIQLILQGVVRDAKLQPHEITKILATDCGMSTLQIGSIFDHLPVAIASGLTSQQAGNLKSKLETVGAQVMLVRTSSPQGASPSLAAEQNDESEQILNSVLTGYRQRLFASLESIDTHEISVLAQAFLCARSKGQQIIILGNGGSAATSSHMANDFLKHGHNDYRFSFRVISLTDNVPWLTAIANDFGYQYVFVQQLRNLLNPGDVVIAISSSGNSPNVLAALEYANSHGAKTFGILGFGGGKAAGLAQHVIQIPSRVGDYGVMEDGCMVVGHMLSEFLGTYDKQMAHRESQNLNTSASSGARSGT